MINLKRLVIHNGWILLFDIEVGAKIMKSEMGEATPLKFAVFFSNSDSKSDRQIKAAIESYF